MQKSRYSEICYTVYGFVSSLMMNDFHCEGKKMEEPVEEIDRKSSPTPAEEFPTAVKVSHNPAEAYLHSQMQVAEAKEQIAALCTAVISSPEDEVLIVSSFVDNLYC